MKYFYSLHIEFSRVMGYNLPVAQNVLFGRFVPKTNYLTIFPYHNAQGLENTTSHIQRQQPHSLWWNDTYSAFLQQTQASLACSEICQDSATQCQLSSRRYDCCSPLRHHGRPQAYQQDRDSAIQWSFPLHAGTLQVSRSVDIAEIPQEASPQGRPPTRCLARPASHQAVCYTQIQNQIDLRSGLCSPHDLW